MFYQNKKWKIRDSSDPEYMILGTTEDVRTQRADAIDRERRQFYVNLIATIVIVLVTIFISAK